MNTKDLGKEKKTLRIGGIHATLGSAAPLQKAIKNALPNAEMVHFVNEEMLGYVNRNGGVNETAMRMFARQVFLAEEAGVDAIVISCNVYAPRVDTVRPFVTAPLLTVDSAMQEHAAQIGGLIGVLGTNNSSVPSCSGGIRRASAALGLPEPSFADGTVVEAAQYLVNGDAETFDRMLTEKALELVSKNCSAIVLAQVTMARAKPALEAAGITIPILTSPDECAAKLKQMLA